MIRKKATRYLLLAITFFVAQFAHAQLQFIENKGQWEKQVDYKADIPTGAFFLEKKGFTVLLYDTKDLEAFVEQTHGHASSGKNTDDLKKRQAPPTEIFTLHSHAYRVRLVGASDKPSIVPDKIVPTYNNYFIGDDQSKWQGDCKIYQAVTYRDVYPNIDIRYYTDAGKLKYDFIIRPGGNINDIVLEYEGVDKLSVQNKELVIGTSVGEAKELYPYTYQLQEGSRKTLDCRYIVKGNKVKFKVKDNLPGATIVIDPTLIFSSFTGSAADNWGYTATPGPDGSFFAGGIVFATGYPTTAGAISQTFNGGISEGENAPFDIAIMKLSPNGASRMYATYLGGAGNEQPHSMICDAAGNLVVSGRTNSGNYPKTIPQVGGGGSYDIFVTRLNATGTAILGSVKIGGSNDDGINIRGKYSAPDGADATRRNYGDDARSEVILDANNNIYLASCTKSANFPVSGTGIQTSFGGGRQDGVIMKFTPGLTAVTLSSFFGGGGDDACFVLSIDPISANLYVAGATTSNASVGDLPGDKTGVLHPANMGGETDGFITRVSSNGAGIIKTTYIGTGGNDLVYGIQFDKFGFPYIMGTTTGDWPVINAAFSNTGGKQFICKLQADLSANVYSTVFGTNTTSPNLSPIAFLVDRCQNVYVSGWGGGINRSKGYPSAGTSGMSITADAIQSRGDGDDFYFFVLERNATSQLFGSFFGQIGGLGDHVDGGTSRFDANGLIYQAICANCGGLAIFPTTPGVWAPTNGSPNCNEAAVKIEMNFGGVGASIRATINGVVDTIGCVPLNVTFTDTLAKGKVYIWNFGDGSPDTTVLAPSNSVTHTYNRVGSFRTRLISIDSSTCNISDTAYATVRVGNNDIRPDFIPTKLNGCGSLTYQFVNTSTAVIPIFKPNTFLWDYGDNTPFERAGLETKIHTYAAPGTYIVRLIADDTTFCNAPDTAVKTIRLAINVQAQFTTPAEGCVPYTALFSNTSLGGTDFIWDFGDGNTSTDVNPSHIYPNTGTYNVRLIAIDTSTCNRTDTAFFSIKVSAIPVAGFDFSPNPGQENKPTQFTNSSTGANRYIWDFGDGESSTLPNPTHQFNATAVFTVCLQAINDAGCIDTICKDVSAKVVPLLDVPNAFTPGKFGANGVVSVVGFGIAKMNWKIYNRWGQVIFETTSRKVGWDGTYKGVLQPMDVYTYTLDVEFSDGKKQTKTGDITLLR